jgi:hypothetical protein
MGGALLCAGDKEAREALAKKQAKKQSKLQVDGKLNKAAAKKKKKGVRIKKNVVVKVGQCAVQQRSRAGKPGHLAYLPTMMARAPPRTPQPRTCICR